MARPTLVVLSRQGGGSLDDEDRAALRRCTRLRGVALTGPPEGSGAVALLHDADLLGATNAVLPRLDASLLDRLPRLRGVVLYATGYDHVDVDLLRSRGVGLSVLPDYATPAVAEHALALLLALATRLHLAHDRGRALVAPDASLRGMELSGRTLGVVGLGRIGSRTARLGAAVGMRVLGCDPDPGAASAAVDAGVGVTTLSGLLAGSDAVALCASRGYGDPPLIGAPEIAAMRSGALLVNVARAALVDTAAAVRAARSGHLRGYAVDDTVLDPVRDGDVLAEGRVLQTGHSAWWRDEALARGRRLWGERLLAAAHGEPLDVVTWPGRPAAARVPA